MLWCYLLGASKHCLNKRALRQQHCRACRLSILQIPVGLACVLEGVALVDWYFDLARFHYVDQVIGCLRQIRVACDVGARHGR